MRDFMKNPGWTAAFGMGAAMAAERRQDASSLMILELVLRGLEDVIQTQDKTRVRLLRLLRILETHRPSIGGRKTTLSLRPVASVSVTVKLLQDGAAEVRVAGLAPFVLRDQNSALFLILHSDDGGAGGTPGGWKSYQHIRDSLRQLFGRAMDNDHAVQQAVKRLRDVLAENGVSRRLVQNKAGVGYRLRTLDHERGPSSPDLSSPGGQGGRAQ